MPPLKYLKLRDRDGCAAQKPRYDNVPRLDMLLGLAALP